MGVFLADMNDFAAMNEVYKQFFPEDPPARTTVGAQIPKIKIEIDCVARVSKRRRRIEVEVFMLARAFHSGVDG